MKDDRRGSFRAVYAEPVDATLAIGRNRITIRISEESAGGLGAISERQLPTEQQKAVRVITNDGLSLLVRVTHCEPCNEGYRVGLQRIGTYYRGLCLSDDNRSVAAFRFAAALIAGLVLGHAIHGQVLGHVFRLFTV